MEPSLITKKALKKILKKNYFKEDNYFNKTFTNIIDTIKTTFSYNWLPILIILSIVIILIYFYMEQQRKKQKETEQFELEKEMDKINNKKKSNRDDFKNKLNYESEYYKMLPRVTNNPEVVDYMY